MGRNGVDSFIYLLKSGIGYLKVDRVVDRFMPLYIVGVGCCVLAKGWYREGSPLRMRVVVFMGLWIDLWMRLVWSGDELAVSYSLSWISVPNCKASPIE